jgi:hypothetical protein
LNSTSTSPLSRRSKSAGDEASWSGANASSLGAPLAVTGISVCRVGRGRFELNEWENRVWVKVHPLRDGGWASSFAHELKKYHVQIS